MAAHVTMTRSITVPIATSPHPTCGARDTQADEAAEVRLLEDLAIVGPGSLAVR